MFFVSPSVCSALHLTWNGDQKLYLYIQVTVCVLRVLLWLNFNLSFTRQGDPPDSQLQCTSPHTVSQHSPAHPPGQGCGRRRPALTAHLLEDSMQQLSIGGDEQGSPRTPWLKRVGEMELLSLPRLSSSATTRHSLFCGSPATHSPSPLTQWRGAHSVSGYHRKKLVWPSRLHVRRNSLSTATAALSLSDHTNVLTASIT